MKAEYKLEDGGMKIGQALAAAIVKHKKAITLKVNRCKQSKNDGEFGLWCGFAEQDVHSWCRWFYEEQCN